VDADSPSWIALETALGPGVQFASPGCGGRRPNMRSMLRWSSSPTISTGSSSRSARAYTARFAARVVLPTPPLLDEMATTGPTTGACGPLGEASMPAGKIPIE
jgi:hypothetical protein